MKQGSCLGLLPNIDWKNSCRERMYFHIFRIQMNIANIDYYWICLLLFSCHNIRTLSRYKLLIICNRQIGCSLSCSNVHIFIHDYYAATI